MLDLLLVPVPSRDEGREQSLQPPRRCGQNIGSPANSTAAVRFCFNTYAHVACGMVDA